MWLILCYFETQILINYNIIINKPNYIDSAVKISLIQTVPCCNVLLIFVVVFEIVQSAHLLKK